ncbi:TPA: hypothetical protein HA219_00180 [Candidatus Woesearchaeota archaeon]|nr:hypothetical protein [Candidatus Woesearchaeota archaeon]
MIIKTAPDKERARSLLKLVNQREEQIASTDVEKFYTIIAEDYYEITKELMTAISLSDGFKATGENAHKDLIDYLSSYKELTKEEVALIDDLRIRRNKLMYLGVIIEFVYLKNNKDKLLSIISKLKELLRIRLSK